MQHWRAGPDPAVNSADEVKQKAGRGAPALRGLLGEMPPLPRAGPTRPQSSSTLSLIRKKYSLSAPSPGRRSI